MEEIIQPYIQSLDNDTPQEYNESESQENSEQSESEERYDTMDHVMGNSSAK
jgi:hypothetical protein